MTDMGRTSANALGNCLATVVVARWEGEFDDQKAQRHHFAIHLRARLTKEGRPRLAAKQPRPSLSLQLQQKRLFRPLHRAGAGS